MIIAEFSRLIVVSIYCWPLSMAIVALAFVPSPPISSNGNFIVIVVIIGVPLYSLPDAPLMHGSITNGNIWSLSGCTAIFFNMLCNSFI
jgi:hypothetical protein